MYAKWLRFLGKIGQDRDENVENRSGCVSWPMFSDFRLRGSNYVKWLQMGLFNMGTQNRADFHTSDPVIQFRKRWTDMGTRGKLLLLSSGLPRICAAGARRGHRCLGAASLDEAYEKLRRWLQMCACVCVSVGVSLCVSACICMHVGMYVCIYMYVCKYVSK